VAAVFIGMTLFVLNEGYGIGPAPEEMKPAQMQDMRSRSGAFASDAAMVSVMRAVDAEVAAAGADELPFYKKEFAAWDENRRLEAYDKYRSGAFSTEASGKRLKAPQATLMAMVIEGVMDANLPWIFIFIGIFAAVVVELLGAPALPFAVGLYLPLSLSAPIMVGGLLRGFIDMWRDAEKRELMRENGILFSSGLIAGEALIGILLAVFAWRGIHTAAFEGWAGEAGNWAALAAFGLLVMVLALFLRPVKEKK